MPYALERLPQGGLSAFLGSAACRSDADYQVHDELILLTIHFFGKMKTFETIVKLVLATQRDLTRQTVTIDVLTKDRGKDKHETGIDNRDR